MSNIVPNRHLPYLTGIFYGQSPHTNDPEKVVFHINCDLRLNYYCFSQETLYCFRTSIDSYRFPFVYTYDNYYAYFLCCWFDSNLKIGSIERLTSKVVDLNCNSPIRLYGFFQSLIYRIFTDYQSDYNYHSATCINSQLNLLFHTIQIQI